MMRIHSSKEQTHDTGTSDVFLALKLRTFINLCHIKLSS